MRLVVFFALFLSNPLVGQDLPNLPIKAAFGGVETGRGFEKSLGKMPEGTVLVCARFHERMSSEKRIRVKDHGKLLVWAVRALFCALYRHSLEEPVRGSRY